MIFSSTTFWSLFLTAVILLYYNPLVKSRRFKNILLLVASLEFYAWGELVFVFLADFIYYNHMFCRIIHRRGLLRIIF
jgi:D-alanyl-lipoteichoic acid acyltransferase DltB (MBOAT superfamily)